MGRSFDDMAGRKESGSGGVGQTLQGLDAGRSLMSWVYDHWDIVVRSAILIGGVVGTVKAFLSQLPPWLVAIPIVAALFGVWCLVEIGRTRRARAAFVAARPVASSPAPSTAQAAPPPAYP